MTEHVVWRTSLRQTLRILPTLTSRLGVLLECDGLDEEAILARLPYEQARSRVAGAQPDARRIRDIRAISQTIGLVSLQNDVIRVTELGRAVLRWAPDLRPSNAIVLGRHAALALSACQLRNPLGGSSGYGPQVVVHPFAFIWRAMLRLQNRISSEELNAEILRTTDADSLERAIQNIAAHRSDPESYPLREPVVTGPAMNDRLIPWMSLASFGWLLVQDKRDSRSGHYEIRRELVDAVTQAASLQRPHLEFAGADQYVQYISEAAALPKDLRRIS